MPGDYISVAHDSEFQLRRHATPSSTSFSFSEDDRASLVVAPSVVSIRVYSGERAVCFGSGFVLDCNEKFEASILTAGTLFRGDNDNLKVFVLLPNQKIFLGEVEVCDFHFNLAIVKIRADKFLPPAKLGHIKDDAHIGSPRDRGAFLPGSRLTALGRYLGDIDDFMVVHGEFSVQDCELDCKELLYSTCKIDESGIGGPMINREAQVVGVNLFAVGFTPFLPINVVTRWLQQFKKSGELCRPWMGMGIDNLYTMKTCVLEKLFQKFPGLKRGVLVDEVIPNSPAGIAGIISRDIILECDGESVESRLQMFDIIWDKVGKRIDLLIARFDGSEHVISMIVVDVDPSHFYSWPSPDLEDGITYCPSLSDLLESKGKRVISHSSKRKGIHKPLKSRSKKRRCIHLNLFKRFTFS